MENKKYTELLWNGKYQKSWFENYFKLKETAQANIEKLNLAFQTVETINESRFRGSVQKAISREENWPKNYPKDWKNMLIWGDNKLVMGSLLTKFTDKIKLIYIDPPFFTGDDFSFKTKVGDEDIIKEPSLIEQRAYSDTWSGGIASYLKYMYERISLAKELLAEDGSIFIHLDWRVSHYMKCILDEIFGYDNFRNEIVWCFAGPAAPNQQQFSRKHNVILWYTKSDKWFFNAEKVRVPLKGGLGGGFEGLTKELKEEYIKRGKIPEDWWYIPVIARQKIDGIERTGYSTEKPQELLRRIIVATTEEGDIVADFFCGSAMAGFIAEKLGRRWIMTDLSKFAIHLSKKRFLGINNAIRIGEKEDFDKQLDTKKIKEIYGKYARPFEIINIGNYELEYFNERPENYLEFILKLYNAETIKGFNNLHGKKGNRVVHVGPLNAPVSMDEVKDTLKECIKNNITKLDILGWEWAYEVNELAKEQAEKQGIDLKLIQIPSINEIKASLVGFDLKLLKMPDQLLDKALLKNIHFNEVSYLEIAKKLEERTVSIKITDFQITQQEQLEEIKDSIKNYSDLIDYWAIDWEYQGDTFHNQWQSYRTKGEPKLVVDAKHTYTNKGKYLLMIKVVDIFGNDTNKVLEVNIK